VGGRLRGHDEVAAASGVLAMYPPPRYKRLLLKLSGEALMGSASHGIDMDVVARMVRDVEAAVAGGTEIAIVIGGGNIFRGLAGAARGMDRNTADGMGMLATVINALALGNAFTRAGRATTVMSAIPMPPICEGFHAGRAREDLNTGHVVIFAAGTGNPYFTTDTAAALRASEIGCDAMAKATQVDGIYSADPKKDPAAIRYDRLTYDEVLARQLQVMDATAIALARDNRLPVIVFSMEAEGDLPRMLRGEGRSTIVVPSA
jgi:uridylate kinase